MARKDVDRGNRFEGLLEQDLANDDFELVSFTAAFEPFSRDAQLRVRFFLPASSSVRIVAQDLDSQWYYRMESKPAEWTERRWNTFGPWASGDVIDRHQIPWSDLGVVVYLDDNIYASGPVAPAFVYHTHPPSAVTEYALALRSRLTIARVKYALGAEGGGAPVREQVIDGDFLRRAPIVFSVPAAGLPDGAYRLSLVMSPRSALQKPIEREYRFHHRSVIPTD